MTRSSASGAPSMPRVQRSSTVDLITIELRNAIYEGVLMPGTALRDVEIAQQLGVSRGPLRESAQRLVQEGLLVARPGQGLRIASIGLDQLEELYGTRLAVEGAALRALAALREPAERTRALERAVAVLQRIGVLAEQSEADRSARAIGDADLDFHFETVRAAGNRRLIRYMATLVIETRLASLGNPQGYIVRTDIYAPHRERLDRVLTGDGEGAVELLRAHFRDTVDRLTGRLSEPVRTAKVEDAQGDYELGPIGS